MVVYFSDVFGLGLKENFVLYKYFGIFRSSILFTLIFIALFSFLFLIALKLICLVKINETSGQNIFEKSLRVHVFLTFIISSIFFLVEGIRYEFNSFVWPAFSSFPLVVNNIYDKVLDNDFHTSYLIDSPKIILAKILELPKIFGLSWYDGIYFYDVVISIIHLPLLFLCFSKTFNQFLQNKDDNFTKVLFHSLIFFLLASGLINKLQPDRSLMGWESAFRTIQTDAQHFSLIFGLLFIYKFFGRDHNSIKIYPLMFLIMSTFLHVLYGLAFLSIMLLYYSSLKQYHNLKILGSHIFVGFIMPLIFLLFFIENPNPLSPEKFIEIYNLTTHSFHYQISELMGWTFIKWLFCYLFHCIIATILRDRLLIKLSFLSLIFFILPSLIQYVGTEFFKIKAIGILGLNRLTAFNSFIFCLNSLIIISRSNLFEKFRNILMKLTSNLIQDKKLTNTKNENLCIRVFSLFFGNIKAVFLPPILTILAIWGLTIHDPLNQIKEQKKRYTKKLENIPSLCDWVRNQTSKNSIIFVKNFINAKPFLSFTENMALSMAIKCIGQRSTFIDLAFPFNESALLEWEKRKFYYHNFDLLSEKEILEMIKKYNITHLLIDNHKDIIFSKFKYVWESEEFALVKIDSIINN